MRCGRTEADEQKAVIQWCILMEGRWPELEYIHHIPNGGQPICQRGSSSQSTGSEARGSRFGAPCGQRSLYRITYRAQAREKQSIQRAGSIFTSSQRDGTVCGGLL